jgi:mannose-6-phosphate isomerase-like protein (cupin superfamily)
MHVVRIDQLPLSGGARAFAGEKHEGVGVSILLVELPPGDGPALHKHAYPEVFITLEGRALFVADDEQREVAEGEIVVVPADTPHRFQNSGTEPLRQINIHVSPQFLTEWMDDSDGG